MVRWNLAGGAVDKGFGSPPDPCQLGLKPCTFTAYNEAFGFAASVWEAILA